LDRRIWLVFLLGLIVAGVPLTAYAYMLNGQVLALENEMSLRDQQLAGLQGQIDSLNETVAGLLEEVARLQGEIEVLRLLLNLSSYSLEDIINNPENYLPPGDNITRHNEFSAEFIVVDVSGPFNLTDMLRREWEICVVVLRDSYNYELSFHISSEDYQNYKLWVGKSAPFNISVSDGPYYESWSFELVINRVAYKPYDNYHGAYSVHIYLVTT